MPMSDHDKVDDPLMEKGKHMKLSDLHDRTQSWLHTFSSGSIVGNLPKLTAKLNASDRLDAEGYKMVETLLDKLKTSRVPCDKTNFVVFLLEAAQCDGFLDSLEFAQKILYNWILQTERERLKLYASKKTLKIPTASLTKTSRFK